MALAAVPATSTLPLLEADWKLSVREMGLARSALTAVRSGAFMQPPRRPTASAAIARPRRRNGLVEWFMESRS